MNIRFLTSALIILTLLFGQVYASVKIELQPIINDNASGLSSDSMMIIDENCEQEDCTYAERYCGGNEMQNCPFVSGIAQCSFGVFTSLIGNQLLIASESNNFAQFNYQIPIYHGIPRGVTPRPPKPVI